MKKKSEGFYLMRAITTLRLLNTSWEEEPHQYYNNFSLFFIDPFQTDNRKKN